MIRLAPRHWLLPVLLAASLAAAAAAAAPAPTPAPTAPTADPQALFRDGNARYFAGDWKGAIATYGELVTRQIEDPAVYHNLGNAYFRSGAYGSAIAYYLRALRLEPGADVKAALDTNLDAARRTLQARYRTSGDAGLAYGDPSGFWHQVTHVIGGDALAILFGTLWCLLFAALITRRLRPARWSSVTAIPLAIALVLAGILLWGRITTDAAYRIAVVVKPDATLRDGRHESAQGKELPEGLEVRILDGDTEWTQVELANGRRGWVDAQELKQI
jgi:tetratricopeptide (TPR) repeat protein